MPALKLSDVLQDMKATLTQDGAPLEERSHKILGLAADFMFKAVARDTQGQVAILRLNPSLDQFTFAYPAHLSIGNAFPVERHSFAGRVILGGEVLVENNVPREPHKDFFERIPDPGGEVRTIQKMVAAPVADPSGRILGVVEVSRTGETSEAAGPDFSALDGQNLTRSCQAFAPFLAHVWKV